MLALPQGPEAEERIEEAVPSKAIGALDCRDRCALIRCCGR
jgi:hypothetical protein